MNKIECENCYFITFMYGASEKTLENRVIAVHPLVWQKEVNKQYPGQYVLKDWKKITRTEYESYRGEEIET